MGAFRKRDSVVTRDVHRLRQSMGLPPIREGNIKCLRCKKEFHSADIKNKKMCDDCSHVGIDFYSGVSDGGVYVIE